MRFWLYAPLRHWKRWVPLVGSIGLVLLVMLRVSPSELAAALAELNWSMLAPLSVALVAALYLWDTLCFWWLFKQPDDALSYPEMLRARGTSYLFTILNYGAGQGLLAWLLAKRKDQGFLSSAARCVMVTYADLCVLLLLGLIGGSLSDDPRVRGITIFCAVALTTVVGFTLTIFLLPARWVAVLARTRWGAALQSSAWRWKDLLPLGAMRLIYTSFGLVYVTAALAVCGIPLHATVVVSIVPLVALVDGLPISVGGFGTREATLLILLDPFLVPPDMPTLVAFSIVWSSFGVGGRALIGLGNLWLPRAYHRWLANTK